MPEQYSDERIKILKNIETTLTKSLSLPHGMMGPNLMRTAVVANALTPRQPEPEWTHSTNDESDESEENTEPKATKSEKSEDEVPLVKALDFWERLGRRILGVELTPAEQAAIEKRKQAKRTKDEEKRHKDLTNTIKKSFKRKVVEPIGNFFKDHWGKLLIGLGLLFLKPSQMKAIWEGMKDVALWLLEFGPKIFKVLMLIGEVMIPLLVDIMTPMLKMVQWLFGLVTGTRATKEEFEREKAAGPGWFESEDDFQQRLENMNKNYSRNNPNANVPFEANKRMGGLFGEATGGPISNLADKWWGLISAAVIALGAFTTAVTIATFALGGFAGLRGLPGAILGAGKWLKNIPGRVKGKWNRITGKTPDVPKPKPTSSSLNSKGPRAFPSGSPGSTPMEVRPTTRARIPSSPLSPNMVATPTGMATNVTSKKVIGQTTEQVAKKTIKETTEQVAKKTAAKGIAKTGVGSLLKKIPGIGLITGAAMAASRAAAGDYAGAGLELLSGAVATIPLYGTAASVGIDGLLLAKDVGAFDGDKKEKSEKVIESVKKISNDFSVKNMPDVTSGENARMKRSENYILAYNKGVEGVGYDFDKLDNQVQKNLIEYGKTVGVSESQVRGNYFNYSPVLDGTMGKDGYYAAETRLKAQSNPAERSEKFSNLHETNQALKAETINNNIHHDNRVINNYGGEGNSGASIITKPEDSLKPLNQYVKGY